MIQRSFKIILIFSRSTLAPSSCSSSWRSVVVSCCWHLPPSPPQGGRTIWSWCFWLCSAWVPHARRISCLPASVPLWVLWAAAEVHITAKICAEIKQEMAATTCKGTANSFYPSSSLLELKEFTKSIPHFAPSKKIRDWETLLVFFQQACSICEIVYEYSDMIFITVPCKRWSDVRLVLMQMFILGGDGGAGPGAERQRPVQFSWCPDPNFFSRARCIRD